MENTTFWTPINMYKKGEGSTQMKTIYDNKKRGDQVPFLKLQLSPTIVMTIEVCVMENQLVLPHGRGSIFW